jgi:membrane-associated protein
VALVGHAEAMLPDLVGWMETVAFYWWFPVVVLVAALLDAVIPAVPSETAVIIGGVTAGFGEQPFYLIVIAGALGAFIGDNFAYEIGARAGPAYVRRASRRSRRRLAWARGQLRQRGSQLLIAARFIPGGRTAVTIGSGILCHPRGPFVLTVALAGVLWAAYAAGLGYWFGELFNDNHTLAFLAAFGVALGVVVIAELIRRRSRAVRERASAAAG